MNTSKEFTTNEIYIIDHGENQIEILGDIYTLNIYCTENGLDAEAVCKQARVEKGSFRYEAGEFVFTTLEMELQRNKINVINKEGKEILSMREWKIKYLPRVNSITKRIETSLYKKEANGIMNINVNYLWSLYFDPKKHEHYIAAGVLDNAISLFATVRPADKDILVKYEGKLHNVKDSEEEGTVA